MISLSEFTTSAKIDSQQLKLLPQISSLYRTKLILKKNGKFRELNIPNQKLKCVQRLVYKEISRLITFPLYVQGGIKKRSILTNARLHSKKEYVLTYDIKAFFPSCHLWKVKKCLEKNFNFSLELREWLSRLITHKNCLPQGAPTSPIFSSLLVKKLDRRINALCEKYKCTYSRYYDDITISGGSTVIEIYKGRFVEDSVRTEGFKINHEKTHLYTRDENQLVQGLVVNNGVDISDSFILEVEKLINEDESIYFEKEREIIEGKISFIRKVNCEKGDVLLRCFNARKKSLFI